MKQIRLHLVFKSFLPDNFWRKCNTVDRQKAEMEIDWSLPLLIVNVFWSTTSWKNLIKSDILKKSGTEISSSFIMVQSKHSMWRQFKVKIENICNWTIAGWRSMHQRLRIYFAWNPRLKAIESNSFMVWLIRFYLGWISCASRLANSVAINL